jgi:small nuclear ribonucleoprotein (snRNP)-like protein
MATNGQESKGPSTAELQRFIRDKSNVEFLLNNGDKYSGTLRWFDEHCYSIVQDDNNPITLLKTGVVGYRLTKK